MVLHLSSYTHLMVCQQQLQFATVCVFLICPLHWSSAPAPVGKPHCSWDSWCGRCRSQWPWLVSWWSGLVSTGTPPARFWCCEGCSTGHRCRPHRTWACRWAGWCSSHTAGGWPGATSWCGGTFFLSEREERSDAWNGYRFSERLLHGHGITCLLPSRYPLVLFAKRTLIWLGYVVPKGSSFPGISKSLERPPGKFVADDNINQKESRNPLPFGEVQFFIASYIHFPFCLEYEHCAQLCAIMFWPWGCEHESLYKVTKLTFYETTVTSVCFLPNTSLGVTKRKGLNLEGTAAQLCGSENI